MTVTTRLVRLDDVPAITDLVKTNREFLAPWEPARDEDYFTEETQRAIVETGLAAYERGTGVPHLILDGGELVGRINLNDIVRGPFQSCHLGYWVAESANGRGVATAAVAAIVRVAFEEMGLHRIQAGTLVHNAGSQKVLARNGFVQFGTAPQYLSIAGRWQTHDLFQLIAPERSA
ncbi:GNAT family N-acetyltransferase [Phytohabitans houttuyneae]|uniref:Ribosomal-protein-alanine acetyltransferase n=1 Tax=Phytohabitans houttuyneae TaxID=1076126 RepID=A0A6V8KWU6_9ACTN|nr:GNAT family N-acetyltransferase [Phytohabitans houttuyneae]GFJ85065.1 ribosomal-protein-alanine acetyltransferase [Phytohabitans houttuyneae]